MGQKRERGLGCGRRLKKDQRPLNFHRGRPRIRVKFYQKRDLRERVLHVSWACLRARSTPHREAFTQPRQKTRVVALVRPTAWISHLFIEVVTLFNVCDQSRTLWLPH